MSKRLLIIVLLFMAGYTAAQGQTASSVITTQTGKDIIPEGITMNPLDHKIYVSSIAHKKIIVIDELGAHKDFIRAGQDGFLEGLGMKIDEKKQWLWAVSNERQGSQYTSQVHAFDLHDTSLKQHYWLRDTVPHLFNDLILHPNGKIYITDTFASSVYEVDPLKKKLNVLKKDDALKQANGIICNADGKIYIACRNGLVQLDYRSKGLSPLAYEDSTQAQWMDGLVYWHNSIIGVADDSIVQYQLNDEGDQIVSERVIDKKNEHFHEPTTAALHAGKLYVIANSYLGAYNKNNESINGIGDTLGPVNILVYTLQP